MILVGFSKIWLYTQAHVHRLPEEDSMPFYAVLCRFNNMEQRATIDPDRKVLGFVEGITDHEAKAKAESLVDALEKENHMSGHHAFPHYNFYFDCEPAGSVTSVEDVLRANADFFEKSYPWSTKLKELTDGDAASA